MAAAAHLGEIDQGLTIARHPLPGESALNLPAQHDQILDLGDRLRWVEAFGQVRGGAVSYGAVCLMMLNRLTLGAVRQFSFSYQSKICAALNDTFDCVMI
jgi:hypothetical protein